TRAGMVREALHTVREEARAPFADGLRGELQPSCALSVRAPGVAAEHDPGSEGERPAIVACARPPLELLPVGVCQVEGRESWGHGWHGYSLTRVGASACPRVDTPFTSVVTASPARRLRACCACCVMRASTVSPPTSSLTSTCP